MFYLTKKYLMIFCMRVQGRFFPTMNWKTIEREQIRHFSNFIVIVKSTTILASSLLAHSKVSVFNWINNWIRDSHKIGSRDKSETDGIWLLTLNVKLKTVIPSFWEGNFAFIESHQSVWWIFADENFCFHSAKKIMLMMMNWWY